MRSAIGGGWINQDSYVHLVDVKTEENNGVLGGVSLRPPPIALRASRFPLSLPFERLPRRLFQLAFRGRFQLFLGRPTFLDPVATFRFVFNYIFNAGDIFSQHSQEIFFKLLGLFT